MCRIWRADVVVKPEETVQFAFNLDKAVGFNPETQNRL
jgi:hypothetical protein